MCSHSEEGIKMTGSSHQIEPIVYVVGDDPHASRTVAELLHAVGLQARLFESTTDFLNSIDATRPGCVILDTNEQGTNSIEVHQRLVQQGLKLPVIILITDSNTQLTVRSLRNGAVTVLEKPCRDDDLWSYVQEGIRRSEKEHRCRLHLNYLECRLKKLAPQDRSVLQLMLEGLKNRSIAKRLNVSLRTVENRRRRIFQVMHADSVAQLTRMVVEYEYSLMPIPSTQKSWLTLPYEKDKLIAC